MASAASFERLASEFAGLSFFDGSCDTESFRDFLRSSLSSDGNLGLSGGEVDALLREYLSPAGFINWLAKGAETERMSTCEVDRVIDSQPRPQSPRIFAQVTSESESGFALGELIGSLGWRAAVVSTPARGPEPGSLGPPFDSIDVMFVLERLCGLLFPNLIAAYDFKESASRRDCEHKQPDEGMSPEQWGQQKYIESTQWCRYWTGRVRGTLTTLLQSQPGFQNNMILKNANGSTTNFSKGTRCVLAFSIKGGPITQTEHALLPGVIAGVYADLTTREWDFGEFQCYWIHFESVDEFVRALQGYGSINLAEAYSRRYFMMPGRWVDGPYNEQHDLLRSVPGETPEKRRERIFQSMDHVNLDMRLEHAIQGPSIDLVEGFLKARANPNFRQNVGRRKTALQLAACCGARTDIMRTLINFRADPGVCDDKKLNALEYFDQVCHPDWVKNEFDVNGRADKVRELLKPVSVSP